MVEYSHRIGLGRVTMRLPTPATMGFALAVCVVVSLVAFGAPPLPADAIRIDEDDVGGVVSGPLGPEAGVWVIA